MKKNIILSIFLFCVFSCSMKTNKESINKNEFKIDSLAFNESNLDSFGKDIIVINDSINKKIINDNDSIYKVNLKTYLSRIEQKNNDISYWEPIKVDTVIEDYYVSYVIINNADTVVNTVNYGKGEFTVFKFLDVSVYLNVMYKSRIIMHNKEFTKFFFDNIIPLKDINKYSIVSFYINGITSGEISFSLNICIPDSDICYPISLSINNDGVINTSLEEEIWEEN
ncbi:MAG: DUF4738 domain-containing protein [Barnesiella sp.]